MAKVFLTDKSSEEILELIDTGFVVPAIGGIVKESEVKDGVRIIKKFELKEISLINKNNAVVKEAKFIIER